MKRLKIIYKDHEIIVQPTLQDKLGFETTLNKNKHWGSLSQNALKMLPFLAWSAARRTIEDFNYSWEEFTTGETAALDVEEAEDENDDEQDLEVQGLGKDTMSDHITI